jgi:hypothetical protein
MKIHCNRAIAYTRNRSNVVINDYRRTQLSLTLRRAWE